MAGRRLSRQEKVQLEQWIGEESKVFELIYSINRDGCNPAVFHLLCNNKGPTVTVLYNTDGSVFGGYTSIPWRSSNAYQVDYKAFLFRLRFIGQPKYTKFPAKGGNNAIYDHTTFGPFFGAGHDLGTFNTTLNKSGNYFTFTHGLTINNSYDFRNVQVQEINNGHTKIEELQVYKITSRFFLETLKDEVQNFVPIEELRISQMKLLLIGPVGGGKSSFFNTINSIFRGHVTSQACSGSAEHSLTTKYRMYQVRPSASSKPLPFRLCDTRGLEEAQGLDAHEVSFIIGGNMPDGYQFNPSVQFSQETPGYIKVPSLKDMVHCIAFVLDGSTADVIHVVLLTKVDKVCHNVENDLSFIFKSGLISDLVDKVSQVMGLPRGHVLPIQNYEKELELDTKISILSLLVLRQMLRFSQDFLFNFLDNPDKLGIHKLEMNKKH
ncbi:hypothetical protein ACJMK2_038070 [Sinanodonta woodiana]|uniref:TLDc domain-containing protein n=1 Tax=Sinanodonta woodiana TaxID=1069815 RepID=A0ABD3WMU5_SINWO